MKIKFDIQFFGGGGSSTQKFPKRDPEPEQLTNVQDALYNALLPSIQNYDANAWEKAQQRSDANMQRQDALLEQLPQYMGKTDSILDEMLGVIRTGDIGSTLTDRMNSEVTRNLNNSLGANLNSLGNRGVLNSSITSQGISRLGQQAANAFNANYLNAFNSVVNGYGSALGGAQGNAQTLAGVADSVGNAANNAFGNASASLMPAYNFWKDWKGIHNGKEDYDYVVKQGK